MIWIGNTHVQSVDTLRLYERILIKYIRIKLTHSPVTMKTCAEENLMRLSIMELKLLGLANSIINKICRMLHDNSYECFRVV